MEIKREAPDQAVAAAGTEATAEMMLVLPALVLLRLLLLLGSRRNELPPLPPHANEAAADRESAKLGPTQNDRRGSRRAVRSFFNGGRSSGSSFGFRDSGFTARYRRLCLVVVVVAVIISSAFPCR